MDAVKLMINRLIYSFQIVSTVCSGMMNVVKEVTLASIGFHCSIVSFVATDVITRQTVLTAVVQLL